MGAEAKNGAVRILGIGLVLPEAQPVTVEPPAGIALERGPAYAVSTPPDLGAAAANLSRRLGRSQRMMMAAAAQAVAMSPAALEPKDMVAVTVGTGLGTIADTVDFLENMVRLDEREPRPAKFINSVHNSAAANIAIAFGFTGENHTIIHEGISFELALWQAAQLLRTGRAAFALVGGVDEVSPYIVAVGRRNGLWRDDAEPLKPMSGQNVSGTLPGEGAGALLLCGGAVEMPAGTWPVISGVRALPLGAPGTKRIDHAAEVELIRESADAAGKRLEDVDLFLLGANGDSALDRIYWRVADALEPSISPNARIAVFKGACGEFYAAGAIGAALAAQAVRHGALPPHVEVVRGPQTGAGVSTAVLYSLPQLAYHSVCTVTV